MNGFSKFLKYVYLDNIPLLGMLSRLFLKDDANYQDTELGKNFDNFASSALANYFKTGLTGQQIAENQLMRDNRKSAWKDEVEGLEAAGLNAGLVYGSGTNGSNPQPNSSAGGSLSELLALAMLPAQMKQINAETNKTIADTDKINSETEGQNISNEFAIRLNESALESQRVSRDVDRATLSKIQKEVEKMDADIALTCQSIAESVSRELVNDANIEKIKSETFESSTRSLLNRASATRVVALLPYEETLMSAKTDSERAAAGLAAAQAAYQNGLIDSGYIADLCKSVGADAAIKDVEAALKNPNYEYSSGVLDKPGRAFCAALSAFLSPVKGILHL